MGTCVHFNLATDISHSHKDTSQYLKRDSGPDIVDDMATTIANKF